MLVSILVSIYWIGYELRTRGLVSLRRAVVKNLGDAYMLHVVLYQTFISGIGRLYNERADRPVKISKRPVCPYYYYCLQTPIFTG